LPLKPGVKFKRKKFIINSIEGLLQQQNVSSPAQRLPLILRGYQKTQLGLQVSLEARCFERVANLRVPTLGLTKKKKFGY
jgi:hypothetical protein